MGLFIYTRSWDGLYPDAVRCCFGKSGAGCKPIDRGSIEEGKRADMIRVKDYDHMPLIKGIWRNGERIC